jgi:hypothetical protein
MWDSAAGTRIIEIDASGNVIVNGNRDDVDVEIRYNGGGSALAIDGATGNVALGANLLVTGYEMAAANGFIVKNTSGATVSAGNCGYIDASREFKTTTTSLFETGQPVFVLQGGANNADIYVTEGPARLTAIYAGSAPASGDYLVFSTTAGSVTARSTMHPSVIGRARAAGSGGSVEIDTLCLTIPRTLDSANPVYASLAGTSAASAWAGTIATLPGGAVLTYNNVSGDESALQPLSTANIGKVTLHNTTRGTSAQISNVVLATNTITLTATVPAGWATTDVITIASQTNTATIGGAAWLDLVLGAEIPQLTRSITLFLFYAADATNRRVGIHPFEADSASKRKLLRTQNGTQAFVGTLPPVAVIQNRICILWEVTGTVGNYVISLAGINVAG